MNHTSRGTSSAPHVLAACDKFRGTATADEVTRAVAAGAQRCGATCTRLPMADGGEGLLEAFGGADRSTTVPDALGRPIEAPWRLDGRRAVIESAAAIGLHQLGGPSANDVLHASTEGVGLLVAAALRAGAESIVVGVGGSATTDGGAGAIAALDEAQLLDAVAHARVLVACDVTTPFTRAATVFGPQKGATPEQVVELGRRLSHLRTRYRERFGVDPESVVGSGAAGGLAGGLAAIGATLVPGADLVADQLGLDAALQAADIVVTGEGRFDSTSLHGKVVGAVVARAHAAQRPSIVVCGVREPGVEIGGAELLVLSERVGLPAAMTSTVSAIEDAIADSLSRYIRR